MLFFIQLLTSNTASALSCEHGIISDNIGYASKEVPLNVLPTIWFTDIDINNFNMTVSDEEGNTIEADFVQSTFNTFQILPTEELRSDTTYEVNLDDPYNYRFLTFTTTDVTDEEPPSAPQITGIEVENYSDVWGNVNEIILNVDMEENSYAMIEVAYSEDFWDAEVIYAKEYDGKIWLGTDQCGSNMKTSPQDIFWIRISAVDQAGNISEATTIMNDANPDFWNYEDIGKCGTMAPLGCNSLSGTGNIHFILILPLMFAYRRR